MKELLEILPAPSVPIESSGNWQAVHQNLTIELPDDFMDFISHYGTGCISDFLHVLNPFAKNKNLNLFSWIEKVRESNQLSIRDFGISNDPPIYPEANGAIPWGYSDNGDEFYWHLYSDNPNKWPTAIYEPSTREFEIINKPMSEVILGFLKGQFHLNVINTEPFIEQLTFQSTP